MLNLAQHALLGRKLRAEEVEELGRPTQELVIEAIEAGRERLGFEKPDQIKT